MPLVATMVDVNTMDAIQLKLIEILADGHFHSGDELGIAVNLSRAAVGKRITRLADLDLRVDAVKGKGYRLYQPIALLNRQRILQHLSPEALAQIDVLDVVPVTESTNQDAMVAKGTPGYRIIVSDFQTAARGRRGKRWEQGFGSSLTFSIARDFELELKQLSQLSLWTAMAVCATLRSLYQEAVWVKWPNDIYVENRKLAGILLEARAEVGGSVRLVVGVGINVARSGLLAKPIDQPWVSLSEMTPKVDCDRNGLLGRVLTAILVNLNSGLPMQHAELKTQWQQFDLLKGRLVDVHSITGTVSGVCHGIDNEGNLLVLIDNEMRSLNAGEVSIRQKSL